MKHKYLTALFLALVIAVASGLSAMADYDAAAYEAAARKITDISGDYSGKTVILHTNDVCGRLDGYAYLPALRAQFEALGAAVVTADAGDFTVSGSIYVAGSNGENAVRMMNAVGYDVAAPGSHGFDHGSARLMEALEAAEFPVVCADVFGADGKTVLPGSTVIKTASGLRIGFFGLVTPEAAAKGTARQSRETKALSPDALYACAQTEIDALRDTSDLVIGLVHLGIDDGTAADGCRSIDLYTNVEDVDFLIDGYSQTVMTTGPAGEPIQSAGAGLAYIGVIVIDNAGKSVMDNFLIPTEGLQKDTALAAEARGVMDAADAAYAQSMTREINGLKVFPSTHGLRVNGTPRSFAEAYNIDGENYFKLRDVAVLLDGTSAQFAVEYDESAHTILISSGAPYIRDGSELSPGLNRSSSCEPSEQAVVINGAPVEFTAYNLGGNNFFRLRDLGEALGFHVSYDAESRTVLVSTNGGTARTP